VSLMSQYSLNVKQLDIFYMAGVDATSIKYREASFCGADGVVIQFRQNSIGG